MDTNTTTTATAVDHRAACEKAIRARSEIEQSDDGSIIVLTHYHWPDHRPVEVRLASLNDPFIEASDMGLLSQYVGSRDAEIAELIEQDTPVGGLVFMDGTLSAFVDSSIHAGQAMVSVAEAVAILAHRLGPAPVA
jgi:hypothetical protein